MSKFKLLDRSNDNYAFIDGIRAIAILWVIVFHSWLFQYVSMGDSINGIYNYPIFNWVTKGDLGVDLFFVISGFLIGSIIFKEIKSSKAFSFIKFYVRRFLRLTPVYVFSMLLNMYFMKDFGENQIGIYWSNILYVSNYVATSPMAWTWSLAIEEQFYLIVPFLLVFVFPKFKNKLFFFGSLSILSILISWYYVYIKMEFVLPFNLTLLTPDFNRWFRGYYVYTHLRFIGLLIGVAAAYLNIYKVEETKIFFNKYKTIMPIITLPIVIILVFISFTPLGEWAPMKDSIFNHLDVNIGRWYEILCRPVFSVGVGFIIMACVYSNNYVINPINNFLSAKFFYPIAQVSYSAYLFHEMFIIWSGPIIRNYLLKSFSTKEIFILSVGIFSIVILIGAVIMYYLIEQPFQRLRNKIKFK
jgi:peptidoglycan/LPS O-acetylase OafA/YrhL